MEEQVSSLSADTFRTPWKDKTVQLTGNKFSKEQGESDLSGLKPWKQPCEMAQWRNSGASKLGGGIQKRIRALQSAPGTTELDFTPVKESSKKPVQAFQKPLGKRLVKCEIVRGSHEVSEDNTRGGYGEASDSTAKGGLCDFSARQNRSAGIAFEVSVGGSHGKQHTRSVPSRMRDKYPNKKEKCPQLEESCRTNTTDSPSKERIAGVELASAPESPTKRKSDFEVTLYLPKAPGVKKVKQDPDESKNVTVSDSSLPSSDEKCMCPPGSPTKGVAFEVNFDGSRPQKQNRARLKSTPFRLKGQAGKRFAGTKTPPPSQEVVGDGTAKVRDSPTMTVTESSPSRVGPGNRSGSRGNTGLTGSLEQFSAKPGLYLSRSDTFELKKGSSVIDSVKESDGHDGVTQNASSDGEGGSVSSSRTLAAKTASNSNETAEAPNANQPAQVCDEPAEKLPSDRKTSLSEKRSKLVRSGTYDKEDVETVLDSMSTEPSVTSESSKEECVDSKMGSEPDTESSEEDESGEASSAGLSDDPCSAGDEDVGVWEDCNGGSGVVTCPNCELTSQNCSCSLDPDHELLEWVETSKQLLQKGECAATGSTGSHAAAQQRRVCDAAEPGTEFAPRRETGTEEPGKTAGSGAECVFTEHGDKAVCSPVPHPRVLVRTSASVVLTGSSVSSEEHRLISDEEQDRGLSTQGNRGTYDLDETVTAEKSEENFVELLDQLATSVEVTLEERSSFASGNQSSSVLQRAAETEEPEHERNGVGMPGDSDTCVDGTFPGGSWIASRNQGPSIDLEQVVGPHGLQGQEEGGGTLDEDQTLGSVEAEKRGTYDFEEVSNILDQSADVETLKRLSQQQDGGTLDEDQTLGSVVTEKRGTYDLEEISNILDQSAEVETLETLSQQQDGETVDESQTLGSVVAEKRGTYDLEEVSNILDQNADVETNKTLSQQQDGETLGESQMLGSVVAEKRGTYDLEVSNILDQSADVETLKTLSQQQDGETLGEDQTLGSVEVEKRGTYDLEEVSNILDQSAEVDVNDLLDELASLEASWEGHTGGGSPTAELPPRSTSDGMTPTSQEDQPGEAVLWALGALASSADSLPFDAENQGLTAPRSRGTYTLDQVAETLEQATTEGGKTFEEAFEDALENTDAFELEDCVPVEPERRVTYTLDGVASVLDNAEQGGATVVEALGGIAEKYRSLANELDCVVEVIQTRASPRSSAAVVAVPSERRGADGVDAGHMNGSAEKRGTYTLDDVSVALENASSEGIPVVEALEHVSLEAVSIAMEKEAVLDQSRQQNALESGLPRGEDTAGTPHRGTYPLEDVSADLEAAKQRGLPLIDALARLTGEQGASDVAETPPNRGTYTLDEVSDSLEAAKERGLPIVELLDRLAGSTGDVTLRPQDAVQRRQENLTNRKTYALATPLETIGENSDVTLFDGTTRRAVSRGSLERMKGESADKSNSVKGLVNTLDFLTSACEVLLSTTATKPAPDPAQSHRDGAGLQKPARNDLARAADRKTYTLEDVALTLEGAKEAGLPVVDALRKLSTAQAGGFKGAVLTNLTRYASKSDSALAAVQASENPDRHTHSMDDMSQVLESATSSGLSVIQALDQLTKDLARFRAAHVGARPGRRSLSSSRVRRGGRSCLSAAYRARGKGFPPLFHKACSLDSVLSPALDTRSSERPETNPGIFGPAEPTARSTGSLDTRSAERLMPNPAFFGQTEPTARSTCSLFSRSSERPETNPGIFGSVDPTARSTGSLSSSSASNVNSEESRRGTYTLDTVSAALDSADRSGLPVVEALGKLSVDTSAYPDRADSEYGPSAGSSEEHRRTLTLKKAEDALDRAMAQGLPVVGALDSLTRSQMSEKAQGRHPDRPGVQKSVVNLGGNSRGETSSSRTRQTSPPKPWKKKPSERNATPKPTRNAGLELEADPFFVEIFANVGRKDFEPAPRVPVTQHSTSEHAHASGEASSYSAAPLIDCSADDTSASEVLQSNNARTIDGSRMGDRLESMSMQNKTCSSSAATVIDCSADDTSASEALQRNNARTIDGSRMGDQLESRSVQDDSITLGPKPRALWRASGSVLDKISTLLDSAGESGVAPADALQRAADLCIDEGEIEEGDNNAQDQSEAVTSQMTLLRMQLEEKRRHIEAEKRRSQEQWEEHRRHVGHTAFWYMMGKARGAGDQLGQGPGEQLAQGPGEQLVQGPGKHLGQGNGNEGRAAFSREASPSLVTNPPHHSPHNQRVSPQPSEPRLNSHSATDVTTADDQRSPPVARSSPIGSPVAWQHAPPAPEQEFETREFRLSNFPPNGAVVSAGASTPRQTARKCWGVSPTTATAAAPVHPPGSGAQSDPSTPFAEAWASPRSTPPWKGVVGDQTPFTPPQLAAVPGDGPEDAQSGGSSAPRSADEVRGAPVWEDVGGSPALSTPRRQFSAPSGVTTPSDGGSLSTPQPPGEEKARKGVALFFGEESSFGDELMTPEQQKKKERFLRQRQKKQEEERARKEEELEKKRRKEAKQREEAIRKMEEEKDRARAEERRAMRARPTPPRELQPSRTPDGSSTFRSPSLPRGFSEEDVSSSPAQKSGFADFSGPQCYVKPSGKSNRKLITNAITYVCLSGAVNKEQKDKCLQAIAESGGYHFMVLFKDALKFRGLYSYNPDTDQAFKVFGIGPRLITGKMVENLYKYNSGAKEFTKIFAKTLSISIDGLTIQKAFWQSNKPAVQSKTMSNLKRGPPRAGQR